MTTQRHQHETKPNARGSLILGIILLSLVSIGLAISLLLSLVQMPKFYWTLWGLLALSVLLVGYLAFRLRTQPSQKPPPKPITKPQKKHEETTVESFTDRHGRRVDLEVTTKVIVKAPPPFTESIGLSDAWDPFAEEEDTAKHDIFFADPHKTATEPSIPITQRYQQVLQTIQNLEIGATATIALTGDSDVAMGRFLALVERMRSLAREPRDLCPHAEQGRLLFAGIARQNQAEQVRILHRTLILGGPDSHWISSVHLPSAIESLEQGMITAACERFQTISNLISMILRRKHMIVVRVTDPNLPRPDVVLVHVPAVMALRPSLI
jgi:hypothetical protein